MSNHTCVIIADNSEEFTGALAAALHQTDRFHVADTASDGERAIQLVAEHKPDILVLDLMLAKKDGISVLKAISNLDKKPTVLETGTAKSNSAESSCGSDSRRPSVSLGSPHSYGWKDIWLTKS